MDEIDRLEDDVAAKRKAVRDHLFTGVAVRRDGGPMSEGADKLKVVDRAWIDHHNELKAAAEEARVAADRAWDRFVRSRR